MTFSQIPQHFNIEAEQSVLGAIFLEPSKADLLFDSLIETDFYKAMHRTIFKAMHNLHRNGKNIDFVTVLDEIAKKEQISATNNKAEIVDYLYSLTDSTPTAENIEFYINIVRDKALLRELISKALNIINLTNDALPVEEILNQAEKEILEIANKRTVKKLHHIKDKIVEVYDDIENLSAKKGEINGVPSGFPDVDRITHGYQKGNLIIIAARPSVGKTAFAINIALNAAEKTNENVAIFSLEMSDKQLIHRMLARLGSINSNLFKSGNLTDTDWHKLTMAFGVLSDRKIYIDDTPSISINEIRTKCRKLKQESGLGLIVIDYLQLIQGFRKQGDNRQQEVSEISRSLKALAKELDVPVIALSQLSRNVEQRQDKRPMLSDLRESGSIEQDADIVKFLYRDDYYNTDSEFKNIVEVIVAKGRDCGTGTAQLVFLKEHSHFMNLEGNREQPS